MATVRITITDRPGGFTLVADSDPPIAMLPNGDPDVDKLTDAQCAGVYFAHAVHEAGGNAEWRTLIK